MAEIEGDLTRVGDLLDQIEAGVANTEAVTGAFRTELDDMRGAMSNASREAQGLSKSLTGSLRTALNGLIFDGAKASDVFQRLGRSVASRAFDQAFKPVAGALGGLVETGVGSMVPPHFRCVVALGLWVKLALRRLCRCLVVMMASLAYAAAAGRASMLP